jgi:mono/diheme cytochrome c family protein
MRFASQIGWTTFAAASATAVLCAGALALQKGPDEVTPQQAEFFETKVRPVLANNCFSCHGPSMQQGGLRLDSLAALLKGGGSGPALKPADAAKSLLLQVVHYDGRVKMPPAGKLKQADIDALTDWVKMGAPWPGVKVSDAAKLAAKSGEFTITDDQRKFWSFLPVRNPTPPAVKNRAWCVSPVDNFILAKLEPKGIIPAPRADRRTLIRRATYDLIGLPPTAEETDAFVRDTAPNAWEKVIDRLLTDPRYGERWGRYWLDVARYADNKGYVFEEDRVYHNGYTYRDYVIRAFNEDLPYDTFIKQQLAADLMPEVRNGDDKRALAAEGFLTLGRRFLNNPHDITDDRIDVTMRGLQGLTVNCARCHDHKFDPISAKDYYALHGIFMSSVEQNPPPAISPRSISEPYEAHERKVLEAEKQYHDTLQSQIAILRQKVKSAPDSQANDVKMALQGFRERDLPKDAQLAKIEPAFEPGVADKQKALRDTIAKLKATYPPKPEFGMALADAPNPITPHVLIRGNPSNLGPEVPRRFLAILSNGEPKPFTQGSGRLELAEAIASRSNPLTARVMVNRVWRWHFGQALVRTPSDFGTRGEHPTNPELLDWLATRFMDTGWSIKKLHKTIMLSNAYMESSDGNPKYFAADPENRLVWHMNRRRLDLEATRDSLLYVAGRLDSKMGGPAVEITSSPYSTRRTVYGFIDRQNLQGLYRTFDFASPDQTSPQRFTTTIPQQALFMMNSPFVVEQAKAVVARPEVSSASDDSARIQALYRAILGRSPSASEVSLGLQFVQSEGGARVASLNASDGKSKGGSLSAWDRYAQVLLMSNEFSFVD